RRPPPRSTLFPYTTLFRSFERRHRSRDPAGRAPSLRALRQRPRPAGRSSARTMKDQYFIGLDLGQQSDFTALTVVKKVIEEIEEDRKSTRLNSSHVKISYA